MSNVEVGRAVSTARRAQDRHSADRLPVEGVLFTGPRDDPVLRTAHLHRRVPTTARHQPDQITDLVTARADGVFLCGDPVRTGKPYRRGGFLTERDDPVVRVDALSGERS